jgi:hypothetical protein
MAELLPFYGVSTHTTLLNQTLAVAEQTITHTSERAVRGNPEQPASALTVQLDHSYIHAAESETMCQLPMLTGMIECDEGRRKMRSDPLPLVDNWLFADTPRGAKASATCYSLIETAKANGLEPYTYFGVFAQTAEKVYKT